MKQELLLVVLLAPAMVVRGQEGQNSRQLPEELAVTRSIVMQEEDELESTLGLDQYGYSRPFERKSSVTAEFEYGLTDRWELDAEVPYRFREFDHGRGFTGVGDVETGIRYGVVPLDKEPVALDVGLALGIPTGDRRRDLGDGRLELEPSFTASMWVGRFNVQANGAWRRAVTNDGDEPRNEFEYNVAVLYPVDQCFLALEGNGISTRESTEYYVTPEVIWMAKENLQFLLAVPIGVTRESADYGVVALVTFEWEHLTQRGPDKD